MNEVKLITNWLIILTLLAVSVRLTRNRKARFVFLTGIALLVFIHCYTNEIDLKEILENFLRKLAELLFSIIKHLQYLLR
jgi:hypothetical protein